MMAMFDIREIFELATRIEENGHTFYAYMAKTVTNGEAQDLFAFLADEELKHKKTFTDMVARLVNYQPTPNLPSEYFDYLRAYTGSSVFQQGLTEAEMAKFADVAAALQYSIQREADSILYYHEIKNFAPENQAHLIDKIIQEERKHYVKLSMLAKNL